MIPTQIAHTTIIKLLGQLEAAQEVGDGLNLNFATEADLSGPLVSNVDQDPKCWIPHFNWITDPPCLNANIFQTPHL